MFSHLLYGVNHSGYNGLGRWSTDASRLSIPIPLGTDVINREYGDIINDSNRRITWDQEFWSVGVAGVSATVYTLLGRWDIGIDFVVEVQLDIEVLIRNLGAAFLRHKRNKNPSGARSMVDTINGLVQIFPSLNIEGRIGLSAGISEAGKGYVRISTFGGASLNLQLPGEFALEMNSWDNMGRHWQITLADARYHIPNRI
ncbi:MAG: hypothetical protein AAGF11_13425 [Myxococcota bacterium]